MARQGFDGRRRVWPQYDMTPEQWDEAERRLEEARELGRQMRMYDPTVKITAPAGSSGYGGYGWAPPDGKEPEVRPLRRDTPRMLLIRALDEMQRARWGRAIGMPKSAADLCDEIEETLGVKWTWQGVER